MIKSKNYGVAIAVVVMIILIFFYFQHLTFKNKGYIPKNNNLIEEGFESLGEDIEKEILAKYMDDNLDTLNSEELKERVAKLRAQLAQVGFYPTAKVPDMSKYALKSQLNPNDGRCTVAKAEDRDKYVAKTSIPEPQCPQVDMDKYVLKSSIKPDKICPPPPEIDYSRYVLKTSLPPPQKCEPCICPKVKVSAGLTKACPPPPKLKCPEVKPCPVQKCPTPKPVEIPKQEKCHSIKYVKVPVVLKKTVTVNENGEIVNETVEEENNLNENYNNNNNMGNNNNNMGNNNNNMGNNNLTSNNLGFENENPNTNSGFFSWGKINNNNNGAKLTTDKPNMNSELMNNKNSAYGNNNLSAFNKSNQMYSNAVGNTLNDQNNASPENMSNDNQTSLEEINNTDNINTSAGLFNANTNPIPTSNANNIVPLMHQNQQTGNNPAKNQYLLNNQLNGQKEKCGSVKFNDVFRKYGVYGYNNY